MVKSVSHNANGENLAWSTAHDSTIWAGDNQAETLSGHHDRDLAVEVGAPHAGAFSFEPGR